MEALGFDNYVEVLKIYLAKYRMVGSRSLSLSDRPFLFLSSSSLDHRDLLMVASCFSFGDA
jgi:hypothetical protein